MRYKITVVLLFAAITFARSQTIKPLKVGDKCPDIIFKNLFNSKGISRLSELKGKLVILDMSATTCPSCLVSVDHLNTLLEGKYKSKIFPIWAMSNIGWREQDTYPLKRKKIVEEFLKNSPIGRRLTLPVDWGDTLLTHYFPHGAYPHLVWINDKGIVIAITGSEYANEKHVEEALQGKTAGWPIKNDFFDRSRSLYGFDSLNFALVKNIPKPLSFHTIIGFLPGVQSYSYFPYKDVSKEEKQLYNPGNDFKRVLMLNTSIIGMYTYITNFGEIVYQPNKYLLLEGVAPQVINWYTERQKNDEQAEWIASHSYCYDGMFSAKLSDEEIRAQVIRQLDEAFGLKGRKEKRIRDCWVFSYTKEQQVKAFNTEKLPKDSMYYVSVDIPNPGVSGYIRPEALCWLGNRTEGNPPMLDETGLKDENKVYITKAALSSLEELNRQLNPYGITVKTEKRELEMLVIREKG